MQLATLDLETDPFEHGKVPKPFCAGFYDGSKFLYEWGANCVARIVNKIISLKEAFLIYAHNGGKFDFFYFLPHLSGSMRIVNGRIIQAFLGESEVRDSYAIMPFPLKAFEKDQIDYQLMQANVRERHREEIIKYLRKDCTALHKLVVAFHGEFGDNLTVGGTALKQLRKRHPFQCGGEKHDERFRKEFYFGGRVQVFKAGITHMSPISIYDVNSMYPHVMATDLHPVGTVSILDKKVRKNTCFVVAEGENYGAFPRRSEDGSLDFTAPNGRFSTTIHEWNAAEHTGTFRPKRIIKTIGFDARITFDEFVSHYYSERKLAKSRGDKIHTLFYKFVLNSSYGKFAQNPENFSDFEITERGRLLDPAIWTPAYLTDQYTIWSRPTDVKNYYNICTGASITGAARALLLKGLADADTPLYCDTDSIICRSLRSMAVDSDTLGDWKLEGVGTRAAICGKKLYAIFDNETCIKKAHKGALLTSEQIERIAKGEVIRCENPVPAFKFNGQHQFVTRRIRRTA